MHPHFDGIKVVLLINVISTLMKSLQLNQSQMKLSPEIREYLEYLRGINQEGPRWGNLYLEDTALREYIEDRLSKQSPKFIEELERLGDRFNSVYIEAAKNAENNPPTLEQFDSYGRRIDKLHLSEGWKTLAKLSTEDGIVSMAFQDDRFGLGDLQRFGQLIALLIYQPAGLYGCPLAMTDGAAYTIKHIIENDKVADPSKLQAAYNRLISRNPDQAWTSGQWMTEKRGGSDVSNTQTIAFQQGDTNTYRLYGYKWFTSATDSQMTLALAKIVPPELKNYTQKEIQKLPISLFFIEMRGADKVLNNMEIVRLKDKLGTRQLPTAEIVLKGTQATLISKPGKGVKYISNMLTVTRMYNASSAISAIKRILALARDYSSRRVVGNMLLSDSPLHLSVLSDMEVIYRGNLIFYLKVADLFSKEQSKKITPQEANLLRMMTPLLKLFTAKDAMAMVSEGLECFGGLGYIEGTGLPVALRDAQVLTIWEGTTNVLCMDFVRALYKSPHGQPLQAFSSFAISNIEIFTAAEVKTKQFEDPHNTLIVAYNILLSDLTEAKNKLFKGYQNELRSLCFGVCRIFIALLLESYALENPRTKHIEVFRRWITMKQLYSPRKTDKRTDRELGLDLDVMQRMRNSGEADSRGLLRPRF